MVQTLSPGLHHLATESRAPPPLRHLALSVLEQILPVEASLPDAWAALVATSIEALFPSDAAAETSTEPVSSSGAAMVGRLEFNCAAARIAISTLLQPPEEESGSWAAAVDVLGLVLASPQAP